MSNDTPLVTDGLVIPASQANPANVGGSTSTEPSRRRIPLSIPRRKLEVDAISGFVLYWFLESGIPAAVDAGYDFVERNEVRLSQQNPASSADISGNTDLGNRVSIIGNVEGANNRPERLVLMKIREDWWVQDHKLIDDRNAAVIKAIFGDGHILGAENTDGRDSGLSYIRTASIHGSGRLLNKGLKKVT